MLGIPEVVVWPIDIGRYNRGKVASIFLVITYIHYIDHTLGIRVSYIIRGCIERLHVGE